jgi:hypothetical protein
MLPRAAATALLVSALSGCAPATVEAHASYYIWPLAIAGLAAVAYTAGAWRARRGG